MNTWYTIVEGIYRKSKPFVNNIIREIQSLRPSPEKERLIQAFLKFTRAIYSEQAELEWLLIESDHMNSKIIVENRRLNALLIFKERQYDNLSAVFDEVWKYRKLNGTTK